MDDRNSFHAASSLCHISSIIYLQRGGGGGPVSQQPQTKCFQWLTDLETLLARAAIDYLVYRGMLKRDVKHVVEHYLVARWRLTGLKNRGQPLDIR